MLNCLSLILCMTVFSPHLHQGTGKLMGRKHDKCCAQAWPYGSRPGSLLHGQPQPHPLLQPKQQHPEARTSALSPIHHPNSEENRDQPEEGWAFQPPLFPKYLIYNLKTFFTVLKQPGNLASPLSLILWRSRWLPAVSNLGRMEISWQCPSI